MAEGRREEAWNYVSHLMAAIHNGNPFRSGGDAKASDFNPTLSDSKKPDAMMPLSMLSGLIVKPQPAAPHRPPGQLIGGGTTPANLPIK